MGDLSEFKASNGWLHNFQARHGIRELDLSGEKLSADNNGESNDTSLENFKP